MGNNVQYQMFLTLENGLPADESNFFLAHYRVQIKFFNLSDASVHTIYSIVESFISIMETRPKKSTSFFNYIHNFFNVAQKKNLVL